jgi:two-component system sensor histidine kinase/response regulator
VSQASDRSPERVLLLTPIGRDAVMLEARLVDEGFACEICPDTAALFAALEGDVGVALIAQEALSARDAESLLAVLDAQEPWSDVPVLLLTLAHTKLAPQVHPSVGLLGRANVMLLQRPMPQHLLLSAVRSAVRARRRQYQMRDLYRELSRAVQLGDLFVAILGHDLRSPLGAIRMSAEAIARSVDDHRARRPAERILRSTDRMTRMIEQLLDLARVRQGQGILLQLVSTNLGDVAGPILQELQEAQPHARLEVSRSGDLGGRWDPDRLCQVVSNLVGNAIQHGAAGHPIRVELEGTERATVRLRVRNVGAIAEGAMPTLFEPFKQGAAPKAGDKGLGLGLFIAREIVRAHGGDLAVRVVDESTLFEATLPREAT